MKNILFVIPTLRMGGAERSLVSLVKLLDKKEYNIDLLLFETGGVLQKEVPDYVNIIEADNVTRAMILEFRYYAKDLLKAGKILAFIHRLLSSIKLRLKIGQDKFEWKRCKKYIPIFEKEYNVAVSYLEGSTAYYVLDKINAEKKIGWIHTDVSEMKFSEEEKKYYERFDKLITISDKCLKAFVKAIPAVTYKISVIENATICSEIISKSHTDVDFSHWYPNRINIVTIGRLDVQKGIDIGIETCRILRDKGLKIHWFVYGAGIEKTNLEKLIHKYELEGIFELEGLAENPYPYIRKADIIVQPSRWEGKSIVLDEAKILGKAIVVTNYLSVKDQIINEVNGLIVDIDPIKIAKGIIRLIDDKDLRLRLENECKNVEDNSKRVQTQVRNILLSV